MDILFRAKSLETENWVYGFYLEDDLGYSKIQVYKSCECHIVDKNTLGQFIKLYDEDETRIFEGDIVRCTSSSGDSEIYYIEFDSTLGSYVFKKSLYRLELYTLWDLLQYELGEGKRMSILGNIYDDKELLDSYLN